MAKIAEKESNMQKRNFFDYFTEVIGWIQIVASPLLLTGIPGFLIYISNPTITRLIIGIAITLIGLVAGIIFATKIWKKEEQ
ncbi:hypothetical protein [Ferruginibacter sp.]